MAWIIGGVTPQEAEELKRRGWTIDNPNTLGAFPTDNVAVFVDNDMFKIMSGPDWEGGAVDKIKKMNEAGLEVCFERKDFVRATDRSTAAWWWGKTVGEIYEEAKKLGYVKE